MESGEATPSARTAGSGGGAPTASPFPPAPPPSAVSRFAAVPASRRVRLGVAAMARKVQAAPLQAILARLDRGAFDLVVFSEATLLHEPPESWPVVDALLSWFSSGFPLAAALRYVALRKPFCVNDLEMEATLRDRRLFYSALVAAGIPTPRHVVVDREKTPDIAVVETDDSIVVGGVTLAKPFVEKPVDAENHDIRIYYPRRMGGGCKRLFRKIEDRSSTYYPEKSSVRREGSYIYELFLMTQGLDVKVYTAGPDYAHVST